MSFLLRWNFVRWIKIFTFIKMDNTTKFLVKRILSEFVSKYYKSLIIAIILMVVIALTNALNAWMMKPILDDVFSKQNETLIILVPIAIFLIALFRGIALYFQNVIMRYVESKILIDIKLRLFGKLIVSDLTYFNDNSSGKLVSHFINDINVMKQSISSVLTNIIREALSLIFLLGLIFYYVPKLALITFVVFPVAFYPIYYLGRKMRKISARTQNQLGEVTKQLEESFRGIRVVKAYNAEQFETKHLNQLTVKLLTLYKKGIRFDALSSPLMESLGGIALALAIFYGGMEVMAGNLTKGTFFMFVTALLSAYKPMKSLSKLNIMLQAGLSAAERIFVLLDRKALIQDNEDSDLKITKGEVELKNVEFKYGEVTALSAISLKVKPGEMVAFVGPSGSGKSTLMNLLLRFYEVESGQILFDGQNIKDYSFKNLRNAISYVSQDVFLFDDSVRTNLTYGLSREVTDAEIREAAKKAEADDFIMDLPESYDTMIGQAGNRLSGGQKQRLVIARAILRNAPIVILDEATSALDPVSEKKVQKAFSDLLKDKTSFVVAHKLNTIEHADKIFFLKHGKVVASGSNEELLKNSEEYRRFYYGEVSNNQD